MGNRLTKIYTRTGDDGTTGLADGTRVRKTSQRVEAYGNVDELNSAVGLVTAWALPSPIRAILTRIQHELFILGGEIATPGNHSLLKDHVSALEQDLDQLNSTLPALKEFILPGGGQAAAACHLARTVARRCERSLWRLADNSDSDVNPCSLRYLNRLSDLLFVICRVLTRAGSGSEVPWARETPTDLGEQAT